MRSGKPPTLWWLLRRRLARARGYALDHVGVKRALHQILCVFDAVRVFLEHLDERGR